MILSLDFDAFYCGVEIRKDLSLKDVPFVISQKQICATASYAARALGIKKLDPLYLVKSKFPDVKIINGEDLTVYKHEGRRIFELIRDHMFPGCPVERLGLEEVRIDISESIAWNKQQLRLQSINDVHDIVADGFDSVPPDGITLSLTPEGLQFECPEFFFKPPGNLWSRRQRLRNEGEGDVLVLRPAEIDDLYDDLSNNETKNNHGNDGSRSLDLLIASFIAENVMDRLWLNEKYRVSIGVAGTVTLAKMVCSDSKPNGLTLIHPRDNQNYLDKRHIGGIPGFGRHVVPQLVDYISRLPDLAEDVEEKDLSVATVRKHVLEQDLVELFGSSTGPKLWNLLAGKRLPVEIPDIQQSVPKIISVEDTFKRGQGTVAQAYKSLDVLAERLMNQICDCCMNQETLAWIAKPKTLQLQLRQIVDGFSRRSKSVPLRTFEVTHNELLAKIRPLFKSLLKPNQDIYLVNIGVTGIEPIESVVE